MTPGDQKYLYQHMPFALAINRRISRSRTRRRIKETRRWCMGPTTATRRGAMGTCATEMETLRERWSDWRRGYIIMEGSTMEEVDGKPRGAVVGL